jgi:CheY-like chemotaxis protein
MLLSPTIESKVGLLAPPLSRTRHATTGKRRRIRRWPQNRAIFRASAVEVVAFAADVPAAFYKPLALGGEEENAQAAGCDEYVAKPYSPRQLLAKIRQYLP